uniref:THAP domain-containing protein 1 n=1 Tax=Sinocyclocheilus rhinocerous TaxID=307959 RepID=A0A673G9G0_9TELE
MVTSCAYPGCLNLLKPKRFFSLGKKIVTFHRFPIHNPERLMLWLLALHLDINTPEHSLTVKRVCSNHFLDDDFKPSEQENRRFLKASAVPITFLQQAEVCMFFVFFTILDALTLFFLSMCFIT